MNWSEFVMELSLWLLCFFKFFAGMVVLVVSHSTFRTVLIGFTAGFSGITFFFFLSEYFMKRARLKRLSRLKRGTAKPKKNFTRLNKIIVRSKQKIGLIGIAFITPTIVSIPVGTIIMAKFYKRHKWAYPSLIISMMLWGMAMLFLGKLFPDFFKQLFSPANE